MQTVQSSARFGNNDNVVQVWASSPFFGFEVGNHGSVLSLRVFHFGGWPPRVPWALSPVLAQGLAVMGLEFVSFPKIIIFYVS